LGDSCQKDAATTLFQGQCQKQGIIVRPALERVLKCGADILSAGWRGILLREEGAEMPRSLAGWKPAPPFQNTL